MNVLRRLQKHFPGPRASSPAPGEAASMAAETAKSFRAALASLASRDVGGNARGPGRRSQAGYTLMELLVVLAILGLLAAIATPMVLHYLDSAKVSTAKTEVSNLAAGLDLFKYDVGRYPTTEEGLSALVSAPQGVDNWNGPYIKKTTKLSDPWGHPYNYRYPGEHGEFDLYSYGAHADTAKNDEKPPIANW